MYSICVSSELCEFIKNMAVGFWINTDCQRKTNKELFAAKHQKHTRPEDIAYARNELEILNKVSPQSKDQSRSSKVQMKDCRAILDLEEYFESGLQSVILTEYLEVVTKESRNVKMIPGEGRRAVWEDQL